MSQHDNGTIDQGLVSDAAETLTFSDIFGDDGDVLDRRVDNNYIGFGQEVYREGTGVDLPFSIDYAI